MEKEAGAQEAERAAEFERILEAESQRLSKREAILTLETKLRIEAARAELEELEKDYPENKDKIKDLKEKIKDLREKGLGREASEERAKAQGFALEVKGFSEEIRKVAQKEEVKKTIKELEDAEKRKDEAEIERKRKELNRHTQELPWLDNEEVKVFLLRYLPAPFHKFFEAHCQVVYDPDITSDTVSPPSREGDKITFTFGPKVLFEKIEIGGEPTKVIKPARLAFQIGRMLGAFLTEPSNWNKVARQMEIEKGKSPSWEDFVGLCFSSPQTARELSEPAYEHFVKCIQDLSELSAEEIKERLKEKKTFEEVGELAPGTKKEGMVSKIARFPLRLAANTFGVFFRRILAIYEEKQIWYDMTISQLEIEEAKLITTRQEHVSDRDKRLWIYLLGGDKLGARGLILSDVTTSDSRWWRYHAYLYAFDPVYRRTGGEEISRESYFFLVRCTRTSQIQAQRWGSKIGEYVMDPEDKKYKRLSRERWDEGVFEEVRKLSARQVLNTADEAFDWMHSMGRPNELDEVFGGDVPLAFREGWDDLSEKRWEEEKYKFETNHFKKINMPDWLIEGAFGNKRTFKIDCDQILLIARLIAAQRLAKRGIGPDPFRSEHYRGIQKQLVIFYTKRIEQYKEWKEKNPGQKIQAYELFDEAIEKFMKIEMPAEEADQIIENEPNIELHRKAEETQENFEKVDESVKKRRGDFEGEIRELPIPDWLKNYLAKNPQALLDLLVHPDITCQEVAREILGEVTRENLRQFRKLSEQIQSAIPVLGQYFRENQERVGPFLRAHDWVRNNDLQPFLESYQEEGKAYRKLKEGEERRITEEQEERIKRIKEEIEANRFGDALRAFKTAFPERATPDLLSSLTPSNIIPIAERISEEEKRKAVRKEVILKMEQGVVQKALRTFEGKVTFDPQKGLEISELTKEQLDTLDNLIQQLAFVPDTRPDGPLALKVSFIRDLKEPEREIHRKYLALKALEATLQIEIAKLPPPKREKAPPPTPAPEREADMD